MLLAPFALLRRQMVFQGSATVGALLISQQALVIDATTFLTKKFVAPFEQYDADFQDLLFSSEGVQRNDFRLVPVTNSGTVTTTGMALNSPFDGTLVFSGSEHCILTADWDENLRQGVFANGALVLYLTGGTLTLTPDAPLPVANTGVAKSAVVHLKQGRFATQAAFAAAVQEALAGVLEGSTITVTANGSSLVLASDLASGNVGEQVCLLTDEQVRSNRAQYTAEGATFEQKLKSASPWLSTATGSNTPVASFTVGPVVLPKDVHTVYLHSDTLAGARDSEGPVMGQRGTVAKIPLGTSEHGEFISESVYRPHLFSTQSKTDITRIDFALKDSRGVILDPQGTKVTFTVTFDTSHMLA